jgi:outer membrane beta-barrel protein
MRHFATPLMLTVLSTLPALAAAQVAGTQQPANEQVIVPQVDRREIKLPKFPSKDFAIGIFGGTYATQNFGSSVVAGLRLGYHITEDIFVEGVYAQTKLSDEAFRQVQPNGIFAQPEETLKYYNLSAGYNILPGEVFIGRNIAKASQVYLIGGVGSTNFVDKTKINKLSRQTLNFGLGLRVLFWDRFGAQVDMREHIFNQDLLGKNESTKNLELTAGLTFYF